MGALRVGLAVAALGLCFVATQGASAGATRSLGARAVLTIATGDVLVRHAVADEFVRAMDGEVLGSGDVVRVGSDGRAIVTSFDGSSAQVDAARDLVLGGSIATTSADPLTNAAERSWSVVTKLLAGSSKFEIRLPSTTASIRGTSEGTAPDDGTTSSTTIDEPDRDHDMPAASTAPLTTSPATTPSTAPSPAKPTAPVQAEKVTVPAQAAKPAAPASSAASATSGQSDTHAATKTAPSTSDRAKVATASLESLAAGTAKSNTAERPQPKAAPEPKVAREQKAAPEPRAGHHGGR